MLFEASAFDMIVKTKYSHVTLCLRPGCICHKLKRVRIPLNRSENTRWKLCIVSWSMMMIASSMIETFRALS